jgi:hypothetical protein
MIRRTLGKRLRESLTRFPVLTVTGPRQSGKTTLVRAQLPGYEYVSLELPDQRSFAQQDPRGFLAQFGGPAILDEAQRAPDLFSYIQAHVVARDEPGQFVLTGSHNFLLLAKISQSLAGRCAVLHLLPFSLAELHGRPALPLAALGRDLPAKARAPRTSLLNTLFSGLYPRIHDKHVPAREWLASYYQTYLERGVRNVLQIGDLELFGRFVRLAAGRAGQLLNLSGLASDCGITHTTAECWISVLEASFIIQLLRPYHRSFGKRLIKSPKLYFPDTGLLCFLLGIRSADDLRHHAGRGSVFESFVHRGEVPELYFWRSAAGREVDLVVDLGSRQIPVEVKSAVTIADDFLAGLVYWRGLIEGAQAPATLVDGGDRAFRRQGAVVYPWFVL